MQVAALNQDSWFAKNYVYILATFWSVVSILYVFLITFWPIPEESIRFADTILGFILGTVISTIINFFMGSAISSKHKDDTISNLAK
jgi:multisubunit Na+/H+ antiporter MnhE subunit